MKSLMSSSLAVLPFALLLVPGLFLCVYSTLFRFDHPV